jgi:hypothetical protein
VHLKEYFGLGEADLDIGLLEGAGIPVLVKGPPTGIFGPGFAGPTADGVTVLVPEECLTAARQVLGLE